jgi:hypothetical protein
LFLAGWIHVKQKLFIAGGIVENYRGFSRDGKRLYGSYFSVWCLVFPNQKPKHQTPNTKHQTLNTKHQTPNTKHQTLPHRSFGPGTDSRGGWILAVGWASAFKSPKAY